MKGKVKIFKKKEELFLKFKKFAECLDKMKKLGTFFFKFKNFLGLMFK